MNTQRQRTNMKRSSHRKSILPLIMKVEAKADPIDITAPTPTAKWVKIEPKTAEKWLEETNTNNRTIREDYVLKLAEDMTAGTWRGQNGEAIRFDKEGRLVDGQHRLWACVLAKKPITSLVIWGVDSKDFDTIGIGRSKNLADFLGKNHGIANANNVASLARAVFLWKISNLKNLRSGEKANISIPKLHKFTLENPKIVESATWVSNRKEIRAILNPTFAGLIHYTATESGYQVKAEQFLETLGNGLGLTQSNPIYHLRKLLLGLRGPRPGMRRPGIMYILAVTIKAWLAYRDDRKLGVLGWKESEEFPAL